jgi:hypothetical protein
MAILQIQPFSINANATFTFANLTITGNLTSANANLGNLATANYFTGVLTTAAQPNITSLGTLSSVSVTGNITSGNANLGNLVTANYSTAVLTTGAQPNITSLGTLSSVSVTGNITSGNANLGNLITANYSTSVLTTGAQPNITSVGTLNGIVGTSVINLTGASNVALGAVGNVHITGGSSGQYLSTDGSGSLSWASISSGSISNGTSNVSIATSGGNVTISSAGNANVFVVTGTGVNISGTLNATGNLTSANANLGNLVTANYSTAVLTTGAQPNITSVGTLASVNVTANLTAGNITSNASISGVDLLLSGNLTVNGTTTYVNSTTTTVKDPVIELGGGANGAALSTNDNKDRGTLLHYAVGTTPTDAFMGWKNANSEFVFASNANVASDVITINTLGNIRVGNAQLGNAATANYFIGSGNNLSNIQGSNVTGQVGNALVAGTVYSNAQPNITSVGTLSSLSVTGNITSGNASLGNAVTANYFIGSGNNLSNIQASNITGTVSSANVSNYEAVTTQSTGTFYPVFVSSNTTGNYALASNAALSFDAATGILTTGTINAGGGSGGNITGANLISANYFTGTLTTGAQPNITSVGTLTSLTVTGNITGGNVYANSGTIGAANLTGTLTTQAQPNITSVGTLASLTVTANITGGNANLGNLVTSNYFAGVLTTQAQPNITSVGTLASLTVTANISAGNINAGNLLTANYSTSVLTTGAQPNITSVGTLASLTVTANITGGNANLGNLVTSNYFAGNLYGTANLAVYATTANSVAGSNVTGQVGNALVAGTVYSNAQPNITSVGTLNGFTSNGVVNLTGASNVALGAVGNVHITGGSSGQYLQTDGSGGLSWSAVATTISSISNGTSNVNIATSGGNVTISSAGNTNILVVTGTGVNVSGTLNATGNLTSVNANLGNLITANYSTSVLTTGAQPNITSVGTLTSLTVTANITSGNASLGNAVTANYFIGSGNNLSNIAGANVTGQVGNALVAGTVYSNAQPNITSLGTLSSLIVTGDTTVTGNLVVTGNTTYINSNVSVIQDPIVEYGGGANGAALSTNDSKDRGALLHYAVGTTPTDAFMGWKNANSEFVFASNANVTTNVVTVNTLGNIRVGNAQLGNAVTANYFIGSGNNLSNIQGSNVSGQVGNALVAGTVYTNAQPNITSVGSLSSLTVAGLVSLQGIGNIYLPGGSANYLIKTDGNGNLSWATPAASGNANISGSNTQIFFNNAGSNTLGASANLTFNNSTNTLSTTNLVAGGTTNLGAVGNVTITGGSSNQYMKTDGSGTLSWASLPSTTVTVDSFTGDGSNAAFTLTATPSSVNYTIVAVGGVFQPRSAYSVSGTTLTFSSTPPNTSTIEVTTINSGVSVASGGGGGGTGYTYSGISANTTLAKSTRYIVNTSSANLTLTLPSNASSTLGDEIGIIDGTGNANTHAITVTVSGGGNIMGNSGDLAITTSRAALTLVYYNSTQGWLLTNV